MEAITKYGSHSEALVNFRSQKSDSVIPSRYLTFPRNPLPKTLVVTRARPSISDHEAANRPLIQFPPSLLDDRFRSVSVDHSEMDGLGREIETLKPRVTDKLVCSDTKERILLIDTLVNLGVAYHFEKEIEEFMKDAFETVEDMTGGEEDMYTISVIFRVFRRYGHGVSSDMFNKFKGENGEFKKYLIDDVRGMLSLYEASYFGTNTEEILDEAMEFTQKHLEIFVGGNNQPHVSALIQNVLYLSQQENPEVLRAREYIRFYEKEAHHDELLLKLAKLNFKFMQLHYIQELQTLVKWWEELDLVSKMPDYFRVRVLESLFWAIGIYMEPQYSAARIILTKCLVFITIIDDTCDAYCTLTEVIGFVHSLERWEVDVVDTLPDHLKVMLRSLIDLYEELKEEVKSEGRLYSMQIAIDELKRFCRADLKIAKWARTGHIPNFDQYMEVGIETAGLHNILAIAFVGMGKIAGKEAYDWLISRPQLILALEQKGRLRDDVATFKDEMSRGEIATGINCYMKQYGVTEKEAFLEFGRKIKHASKQVNEEFLRTTGIVPLQLLRVVLNLGPLIDVNYKYGDRYTYTEMMRANITSLFIDLITL